MTAFEPTKSLQNCFLSSESCNLTVRESFSRYLRYFLVQKDNIFVSLFREVPSDVTFHTQFIHVFVHTDKRQEISESKNLRQ